MSQTFDGIYQAFIPDNTELCWPCITFIALKVRQNEIHCYIQVDIVGVKAHNYHADTPVDPDEDIHFYLDCPDADSDGRLDEIDGTDGLLDDDQGSQNIVPDVDGHLVDTVNPDEEAEVNLDRQENLDLVLED